MGCGVQIANDQMLSSAEVEDWLKWVAKKDQEGPLPLKAICAPQYFRVEHESLGKEDDGRFPPTAKDAWRACTCALSRTKAMSIPAAICRFRPEISGRSLSARSGTNRRSSAICGIRVFLSGRCGACDFKDVCGGCRARGFYAYGDVLAEEPYCVYTPSEAVVRSRTSLD